MGIQTVLKNKIFSAAGPEKQRAWSPNSCLNQKPPIHAARWTSADILHTPYFYYIIFLFLLFVCFWFCFLLEEDSAKACPLRFGDQTYILVFYWAVWALNWSSGVARVTVRGNPKGYICMPSYAATLHIRPNLFHAVFDVIVFCILLFWFCFLFRFGTTCKRCTKNDKQWT